MTSTDTGTDVVARLRATAAELRGDQSTEGQINSAKRAASACAAACTAAHEHLRERFPQTLAPLLPDASAWTGYTAYEHSYLMDVPYAVASLTADVTLWFLHFPYGITCPPLTVMFPCPCGRVISLNIPDEHDLVHHIADLLTPSTCTWPCRYAPGRAW